MQEILRRGRASNCTFNSQEHFCGKVRTFLRVRPIRNKVRGRRLQPRPGPSPRVLRQISFVLRTLRLALCSGFASSECDPCGVLASSSRWHSTNFYQPDMTP